MAAVASGSTARQRDNADEYEEWLSYTDFEQEEPAVELDAITLKFSDGSWEDLFVWQAGFYLIKHFDVLALVVMSCLTASRLLLEAQDRAWLACNSIMLVILVLQAVALYCVRTEQVVKARSVVVGGVRLWLVTLTARLFGIALSRAKLTSNTITLLLWTSLPHAWVQICMPVPFKYNIFLVPVEFVLYSWTANSHISRAIAHSDLFSSQIHAVWTKVNNWSNMAVVHLHPHAAWLPPVELQDVDFMCKLLLLMWQVLTGACVPLVVVYFLERTARKQFALQPNLQGVLMAGLYDGLHTTLSQAVTAVVFILLTMVAAWQVLLTAAVLMT